MREIKKYCISGTLLVSFWYLFTYNAIVFGGLEQVSSDNKELPVVSQKDVKGEEEECCEETAESSKLEVNTGQLQSLPLPSLPDIIMINQDGKKVRIYSDILKGKITAINFIYTSCKSVCQILTNNFRQLEKGLDSIDKNGDIQLVSISIDPQVDNPARLLQYAKIQRIDLSRWTLLVSGLNSIERLSRALGFSNVDKSTHAPGVVIWDDIDKNWQRFAGLTPPHIVLREIKKLPAVSGKELPAIIGGKKLPATSG